ncbi:MAG: LamG domain-containing protein, partial [Sediminibacterium sp.]|nr:LamG domain-containing protein [Sediminibacterium sp.]
YTYQWYGNTVNSRLNGFAINSARSQTFVAPKDTAGNRFYWAEINDSIVGSNVCRTTTSLLSQILGNFTTYLLPDTTGGLNSTWRTGDTACRLNTTPFKTLSINLTAASVVNSNITYQWFIKRVPTGGATGGSVAQSQALVGSNFSFTPRVDSPSNNSNPQGGTNYYYAVIQNGSRTICQTTSTLSANFQLIDTTNFSSPVVTNFTQFFNFGTTDSLRFLVPTPISSIIYYNALTGGNAFTTPVSPYTTSPFSGYKLKSDSLYYVVNRVTTTGRTCESYPRLPIFVKVNRPPQQPNRPTVTLSNNANNQTMATVQLSSELLDADKLDSPTQYNIVAVTYSSLFPAAPIRTIIIDTARRGSAKFTNLLGSGLAINVTTLGPLGANGILNKERFIVRLQAQNVAGTRNSLSAFTVSGVANDTIFSISPLRMNSYKAISFNTRYSANQTAPTGDPVNINYIKIPTFGSDLNSTNYTVEFWVKYNNAPGTWSRFFDFSSGSTTANGILLSPNDYQAKIGGHTYGGTDWNNSGLPASQNLTPANLATNFGVTSFSWQDWHHVAFVLDSSNLAKLYVDGVYQVRFTGQAQVGANLINNYIARSTYGTDPSANLQMQDFRIWRTARSEQEIAENFSRNMSTLTAAQRTGLYYWLPLTPNNEEKRAPYNIAAAQAKNATGFTIPSSPFASSNSTPAIFYGAPESATNNPQFTYDSNLAATYNQTNLS